MKALWQHLESAFASEIAFRKALLIVPVFYYFVEFMCFGALLRFPELSQKTLQPFWGTAWTELLGPFSPYALHIAMLAFFAGTFIACVWYQKRWARVAAFFAVFQFQAFMVAFDGQANEFYAPLYISLLFIFLPNVWERNEHSTDRRRTFLVVFWGAQAYLMLTYFQSGMYKFFTTLAQIRMGEPSFFSPDAGALFTAHWLVQYDISSILGPFIIEHPYVGWAGLLLGLYVLLFALWAAFVPALHRLWAIGIILFHFSTVASIGILFWFNTFFVLLLLANSPFAPERPDWRQTLRNLPLFGMLARLVFRI